MRHGSAAFSFNIFSTNGMCPPGLIVAHSGSPALATGRADHARMLAHAATRRLAAQGRTSPSQAEDRAYWKACAPVAVRRAIAIRQDAEFAKLP
jgi:hypothetical protein